jgi:heptosyltransferase III
MSLKRFVEIWQHRFRVVLNIISSCWHWLKTTLQVRWSRLTAPNQPHIAILLAEHFGDIVACEPLTRQLKQTYPTARLYWIARKPYRQLVDYNPHIDVVIEEFSVLHSILLTKWSPFNVLHNCQMPDLRHYTYLNLTLDNPQARQLGINSKTYFTNNVNILQAFAQIGGLPIVNEAPRIYVPNTAIVAVDRLELPKRFVVMHCHSNYAPKDWQIAHWQRLVADLTRTYPVSVVEIGLKSTLSIKRPGYVNLCGQLSLLETAEVIRRASFFIGIDSGPAHFANAVSTFGFLLFGRLGTFDRYMPYSGDYQSGKNARFIIQENGTCSELPYEAVWSVIRGASRMLFSQFTDFA